MILMHRRACAEEGRASSADVEEPRVVQIADIKAVGARHVHRHLEGRAVQLQQGWFTPRAAWVRDGCCLCFKFSVWIVEDDHPRRRVADRVVHNKVQTATHQ